MPGNRYSVSNVFTGQVTLWVAAANSPIPADSVAIDTDWSVLTTGGITAGMWRAPGATQAGWSTEYATTTNDITIEEQSIPAATLKTATSYRITGVLSEDVLENVKLAYGGGTLVTTAAASGVIGKKTLTLSDTMDSLAVAIEGLNKFGFFRRIYIPVATSTASVTTPYRRAAGQRVYAVQFNAACAINQIVETDMTAVALP